MTYYFTYSKSECQRIIPAALIDSRGSINDIKNKVGSVIKTYTDQQSALVTEEALFYKIETEDGNLVGYFILTPSSVGTMNLVKKQLRPAFVEFDAIISGQIANFILSGDWNFDKL